MIDAWYYGRDENKVGPCSGRHLKELADSGQILPTDSIWKEGIERSVLARKVKNLFAAVPAPETRELVGAPASSLPAKAVSVQSHDLTSPDLSETLVLLGQSEHGANDRKSGEPLIKPTEVTSPIPSDLELRPIEESPLPPPTSGWGPKAAGTARAIAGKGAIIVGQDGTNVQFRKKCTTCGHEDNCRSRMPIRQGTTKVGFYCSKCRKRRDVEIQGFAK